MFYNDEELARAGRVGVLVHTAVGRLAPLTRTPTVSELRTTADGLLTEFRPIEARAHRQNIAALTGSFFWHLLPPPAWVFAGTELDVGSGRVDLLWRDSSDRLLIDEIKTGSPREVAISRTRNQVQRYLDCAGQLWPDRLLGIRVLCLSDPRHSQFARPDGTWTPLHTTPYIHTPTQNR